MKVGDLIKYGKDDTVGVIVSYDGNNYYTIHFAQYRLSYCTIDDVKVLNESR